MIDGVIYDMDGVLVDSEPLWKRAMIEVWATVGVVITEDDCRRTQGLRIDEVAELWGRRQGWDEALPGQVARATVGRVIELVRAEATLLPGVTSSIEFFAELGLPCGIASSSDLALIEAVVDAFGLGGRFVSLVSAEHEEFGKPHPGVYLRAARDLGVDPARCLAVEDSPNGIVSAKAARMRVLCVPDPAFRGDRRLGIADMVLASLEELDESVWTTLVSAAV